MFRGRALARRHARHVCRCTKVSSGQRAGAINCDVVLLRWMVRSAGRQPCQYPVSACLTIGAHLNPHQYCLHGLLHYVFTRRPGRSEGSKEETCSERPPRCVDQDLIVVGAWRALAMVEIAFSDFLSRLRLRPQLSQLDVFPQTSSPHRQSTLTRLHLPRQQQPARTSDI